MSRRRTMRILNYQPLTFGLNSGFVDQHDRDVVLDRVDPVALAALERRTVLDELYRGLAVRARKDFEQLGVDWHRLSSGLRLCSGRAFDSAQAVPSTLLRPTEHRRGMKLWNYSI